MNSPCPNCGQMIVPEPGTDRISCPSCNEGLVWSAGGGKLLIEKPLSTYLDTVNEESELSEIWTQADQSEQLIDVHRRQATVELATRWVSDRIAMGNRILKIGSGILILSVVLIFLALGASFLKGKIQIDTFLPFILASLIAPFGVFFFSWSLVERFSIAKYMARIQEERQILEEQEKYFST